MQIMLDAHQPERWIFGHYHVDKDFYTPGYKTKFRCIGGMMNSGEPPHTYVLNTEVRLFKGVRTAQEAQKVILSWRCGELLMSTDKGLYIWTRSAMTKDDKPHEFRAIKDNELWEWL